MTERFINPTASGHRQYDDETLAEEGMTPDVLDVRERNVGVIVLAQPQDTTDEFIEAGLTLILVNDERHEECPPEPHNHDHTPIASGRITYSKAMNLAIALMTMCLPMVPISSQEKRITERINAIMEQYRREAESIAHTESAGGHPYNVI